MARKAACNIAQSQAKEKTKEHKMLLDPAFKDNETMIKLSATVAKNENDMVEALCLAAARCKEDSVNMVQGWRRKEPGWVRMRSVLDRGRV